MLARRGMCSGPPYPKTPSLANQVVLMGLKIGDSEIKSAFSSTPHAYLSSLESIVGLTGPDDLTLTLGGEPHMVSEPEAISTDLRNAES